MIYRGSFHNVGAGMNNEVTVMNWFFGITMGTMLLVWVAAAIYSWARRRKVERIPRSLIFPFGYVVCSIASMNLRDRYEWLAIAFTIVGVILVVVWTPLMWRRFLKHLRDEGLISAKRSE